MGATHVGQASDDVAVPALSSMQGFVVVLLVLASRILLATWFWRHFRGVSRMNPACTVDTTSAILHLGCPLLWRQSHVLGTIIQPVTCQIIATP